MTRIIIIFLFFAFLAAFVKFGPFSCSEPEPTQGYRLDLRHGPPRVVQVVRDSTPERTETTVSKDIERENIAEAIREAPPEDSILSNQMGMLPVEPDPPRRRSESRKDRKSNTKPSIAHLKKIADACEEDSADIGEAMQGLNNISHDALGVMQLLLNPRFMQKSGGNENAKDPK